MRSKLVDWILSAIFLASFLIVCIIGVLYTVDLIPLDEKLVISSKIAKSLERHSFGFEFVMALSILMVSISAIVLSDLALASSITKKLQFTDARERLYMSSVGFLHILIIFASIYGNLKNLIVAYVFLFHLFLVVQIHIFLKIFTRIYNNKLIVDAFFGSFIYLGVILSFCWMGSSLDPYSTEMCLVVYIIATVYILCCIHRIVSVKYRISNHELGFQNKNHQIFSTIFVVAYFSKAILLFVLNLVYPTWSSCDEVILVLYLLENILFLWATCILPNNFIIHDYISLKDLYIKQQLEAELVTKKQLDIKEEIIRYVSHEMRTPLMVVNSSIDFAIEDLKGRTSFVLESQDFIDTLSDGKHSCEEALKVLGDILTYESIQAGKYIINSEFVAVVPFLRSMVKYNKLLGEEKKITFEFINQLNEGPEDEDSVYVHIDISRFEQVFRNLFTNSVKFSGNHTKIRVILKEGTLIKFDSMDKNADENNHLASNLSKLPAGITISVVDEGIGMSTEETIRAFGRFNQFDPKKLQGGGGTGLGLFISKNIVDSHCGSIEVFSDGLGRGTTFTIRLDAYKSISERSVTNTDIDVNVNVPLLEEMKFENPVLSLYFVDDSSSCRKCLIGLCKRLLFKLNCKSQINIKEFSDGLEIVQAIQSLNNDGSSMPDCIFIDNIMNYMHGTEAIFKLRQMNYTGVIIAVSGCTSPSEREEILASGADILLPKPVTYHGLLSSLKRTGLVGDIEIVGDQ